jgi:endonuclease/exonuclease/phosphatase (EEP) superfamily protein YafD
MLGRILTSRLIPVLLFAAWLAGQLVRDRSWLTGLFFYVPSPVVALVALTCATGMAKGGRWRTAVAVALLALPPAWVTAAKENRWGARSERGDGRWKLVHWNVFDARLGAERVARALAREDADLYVLSELAGRLDEDFLAAAFGDGRAVVVRSGLGVVARGTLDQVETVVERKLLLLYQMRWRWEGGELRLFVADSASNLFMARDPNLREIAGWIERRRPDLVVGDFNAPRRSRALWPPPPGFAHAYDASGSGWSYTWPSLVPLLAIDQCLIGPRISPGRYRLGTSALSDHRIQSLTFDLR